MSKASEYAARVKAAASGPPSWGSIEGFSVDSYASVTSEGDCRIGGADHDGSIEWDTRQALSFRDWLTATFDDNYASQERYIRLGRAFEAFTNGLTLEKIPTALVREAFNAEDRWLVEE